MMKRHLEKLPAASAIALEAAAVALLWGWPAHGVARAAFAAVAHAMGAACAAAFLARRAAQPGVEGRGRGAWLLFATVSTVLPLVGPGALAALLARMTRPHAPKPLHARAPLTEGDGAFPFPTDAAIDVGQGSLEARLRFDPAPASRLAAVLATRRLQVPADAVRLLKLAVRDRDEDVRLLAHALLDDRDREAFRRIESLEQELAASPAERRGPIQHVLADALCELCVSGLVSGELETFTLRQARALIDEARAAAPIRGSASAAVLLGRVLLRQGDAGAAQAAFEESGRLGAPSALLAGYLAEVAFQARTVVGWSQAQGQEPERA